MQKQRGPPRQWTGPSSSGKTWRRQTHVLLSDKQMWEGHVPHGSSDMTPGRQYQGDRGETGVFRGRPYGSGSHGWSTGTWRARSCVTPSPWTCTRCHTLVRDLHNTADPEAHQGLSDNNV